MINGEHVSTYEKLVNVIADQVKSPIKTFILGAIVSYGLMYMVNREVLETKRKLISFLEEDRDYWRDRYTNSPNEMRATYDILSDIKNDKFQELEQRENLSLELEKKIQKLEEIESKIKDQ